MLKFMLELELPKTELRIFHDHEPWQTNAAGLLFTSKKETYNRFHAAFWFSFEMPLAACDMTMHATALLIIWHGARQALPISEV